MSQCGSIDFLSGGTLQGTSIIQSDITSSSFTSGTITTSEITNLAGIDSASVKKIVEVMCELDENTLKSLAEALGLVLSGGSAPSSTTEDSLPTKVYGDRDALLGEPDEWISVDGRLVPTYGG